MKRCERRNPDGSVCRKRPGKCIHDWKPTRFGVRSGAPRQPGPHSAQPRGLKALIAKVAKLAEPFRRSV